MKGRLFLRRKHYDDTGFESRAQTLTTHTYFTRGRSILYWNIHCNAMCALTVIRQGPSTKVIISACLSLRLIQTCGASSIARLPLWCYLESRVGTVLKTHSRCWLKWKRVLSRFSLWRARRRDREWEEWQNGVEAPTAHFWWTALLHWDVHEASRRSSGSRKPRSPATRRN